MLKQTFQIPSPKTISLRLPEHLLAELKLLANRRDIPYQSLLQLYLAERVEDELRKTSAQGQDPNGQLQQTRPLVMLAAEGALPSQEEVT